MPPRSSTDTEFDTVSSAPNRICDGVPVRSRPSTPTPRVVTTTRWPS